MYLQNTKRRPFPLKVLFQFGLFPLLCLTSALAEEPVDFKNDIVATFTKAGCNAGACHGAAIGRGGFKLSLYGGNPKADFESIVYDLRGRRINRSNPGESLLLLKPTEYVSHEGGTIFDADSDHAKRILQWIREGATNTSRRQLTTIEIQPPSIFSEQVGATTKIKVVARYTDGTSKDVTPWAILEPADKSAIEADNKDSRLTILRSGRHIVTVRYLTIVKPIELVVPLTSEPVDFQSPPIRNLIDHEINRSLENLRIIPSGQSPDGVFYRRLSLDLTGRLPSVSEIKTFLDSKVPNKRVQLIDQLLNSEQFNTFWAFKLSDYLRIRPRQLGAEAAQTYFDWLISHIRNDTDYRQIALELILAQGESEQVGPANFYRTTINPRQQAEFTSELFMGTRLRCANCHNHPLDHWTQDDYHGLAAIFAKVDVGQAVTVNLQGATIHPVTLEPAIAKIPSGDNISPAIEDPRSEFAQWLINEDNPYFAKAIVNRLWKQLMGRGLVEPVDDFRSTNPPTHPELMDKLAADFKMRSYSIKSLIRLIANSSAYQRSSSANVFNRLDEQFYSHAIRRPLEAAVLADAASDVLGVAEQYGNLPLGTRAIEILDPTTSSRTLDILGRCDREESCEDTGNQANGLTKRLHLFNGEFLNARITVNQGRLSELLRLGLSDRDIITEYYLAAYSRYPTDREISFWETRLSQYTGEPRRNFLQDFVWAILNSKDFTTDH